MKQYLNLLKHIVDHGSDRTDRTHTGTRSSFGYQMRFDLSAGFPLVTTKRVFWKGVVYELLWFLRGDTNIQYLVDHNVHIWDEWADDNGDLGPVYGAQWRSWRTKDGQTIDQIADVITSIKTDPYSRRHIICSWNVGELSEMALAPCHTLFQFYVADNKLSCQLYQRSCDMFLGVPFNIAGYALLTMMVAQQCALAPGAFVWTGGDCHIYHNHFSQVDIQLKRQPKSLPRLEINRKPPDIFSYRYEDFTLIGYQPAPTIKAPIAV